MVEGKDDEGFFEEYLKFLEIYDIQIFNYQGKTQLKSQLKILSQMANFIKLKYLIIQIDYDKDKNIKFIKKALESSNYLVPSNSFELIKNDNLSIAFINTPHENNSQKKKELESLCIDILPVDNQDIKYKQILDLAKKYVDDVLDLHHEKPTTPKKDKSILHAYLSVFINEKSNENNFVASRLNEVSSRNCFDFNSPYMTKYKEFFDKIS